MSGHTQRRVICISGLPGACFPCAAHVSAYAIGNSPGRTASSIASLEAGQDAGIQVRCPSTLTATTPAGMISTTFPSPVSARAVTTPAGMISNNFGSYIPCYPVLGFWGVFLESRISNVLVGSLSAAWPIPCNLPRSVWEIVRGLGKSVSSPGRITPARLCVGLLAMPVALHALTA